MLLFPETMYEVLIAVPKKRREATLDRLRGMMQLQEFEYEGTNKMYPDASKVANLLSGVESLIDQLDAKGHAEKSRSPIMEAEERVGELEATLQIISGKSKKIQERLDLLNTMVIMLDTARFLGLIQIFAEDVDRWDEIRKEFEEKDLKIIATQVLEKQVVVLAKGTERGFNGDERKVRTEIYKEMQKLRSEIKELEKKKSELSRVFGPSLNTLKIQLEAEVRLLEDKKKLTHSELFTFIKGWVPERHLKDVETEGVVLYKDAGMDAPTLLSNPAGFRAFEDFMYMFALPRYGEFDPTSFIAIFFPLFYGIMLSDAGYGFLLLILSLILRRKYKTFSEILMISSISTIVFGVFFDSYFGFQLGKEIINPLVRPFDLLYYSLIFGVFYVDLGLIMGLIQNVGNLEFGEALSGQLAPLLLQFGVAAYLWDPATGFGMIFTAVLLKVWFNQIRGLLEVPGFMSTIVSFSRLAALALATVWVAFTVNFLAGLLMTFPHGAVLAAGVLIVGHLANFIFNALGAFIHALRLHYVEFMGSFFSAKGKPFTPLGV